MLGASGLVAVAVLAVGLNVADIARGVWQQGPMPGARGRAISAQAWTPPVEDPADRERDRNNAYLQRKAAEREHGFQQQQRQQAEERRDLRLERRLDAERHIKQDRPGWPGR
jgi:hypothetical protein